jgi:hypothetical protein
VHALFEPVEEISNRIAHDHYAHAQLLFTNCGQSVKLSPKRGPDVAESVPQQLVDPGLAPRLRIDGLDDHCAV